MISQFITFLKEDINAFVVQKKGVSNSFVNFSNLNNVLENNLAIDNKIIISIVNIEEEKLLKTPDNYVKIYNDVDKNIVDRVDYRKPPVWLNIICLFTYYTKSAEDYNGIDLLSHVVQYFQSRPLIDSVTAVVPTNFPNEFESIRSEFVSLNYEQTNYLWGLFGGKYHPSVVYKLKSIPIDNMDTTEAAFIGNEDHIKIISKNVIPKEVQIKRNI